MAELEEILPVMVELRHRLSAMDGGDIAKRERHSLHFSVIQTTC